MLQLVSQSYETHTNYLEFHRVSDHAQSQSVNSLIRRTGRLLSQVFNILVYCTRVFLYRRNSPEHGMQVSLCGREVQIISAYITDKYFY